MARVFGAGCLRMSDAASVTRLSSPTWILARKVPFEGPQPARPITGSIASPPQPFASNSAAGGRICCSQRLRWQLSEAIHPEATRKERVSKIATTPQVPADRGLSVVLSGAF